MKKITISVVLSNILLSSTLLATTIELDEITVTASPSGKNRVSDIPCQVDIIKSKEITTASLGEALSSIAGVNNNSTGSQAGKPIIRGMSGERVKILSNGSPTDFQTYGNRHIATIDPLLSEKIEVVRGAQGVLYGSDALGGVVNVISPKYLYNTDGSTTFKGDLKSEYKSNNNEKALAVKTQSAIGNFGINISASTREGGNFTTGKSDVWQKGTTSDLPLFAGELPFTDFKTKSAQVGVGYTGDTYKLSLQHTYWQSYQNFLGHEAAPSWKAIPSAGQDLTNNETQLNGQFALGEWILKPTISHTNNRRIAATGKPYKEISSTIGTIDYLDLDVTRTDMKLAVTHPSFFGFDGEIGIEGYDKEQILKAGKLAPTADEKSVALYIFEEKDLGDIKLQGGIRYDTKSIKAPLDGENNDYFISKGIFNATNNSKDFSSFGGSIGATYKINSEMIFATNISKGFRAPSIFELYAGGVHGGVQAYQIGNPELKAEESLGLDLSLRYKTQKSKANITLYSNYINDYIYIQNTGYYRNPKTGQRAATGLVEMQNAQTDARLDGIEIELETKATDSITLRAKAEYIQGKDLTNNNRLSYIPANNLAFGVSKDFGTIGVAKENTLTLDMRAYESQKVAGAFEPFAQYNSTPFGSADTKGYALFDIGYNGMFNAMGRDIGLGIKVTNLFDRAYRDYMDTYKGYTLGMGRSVNFNISVPF